MLVNELVEEVQGADCVCLDLELLVAEGVHEDSQDLLDEVTFELGEKELEVAVEELQDHQVGPFVDLCELA